MVSSSSFGDQTAVIMGATPTAQGIDLEMGGGEIFSLKDGNNFITLDGRQRNWRFDKKTNTIHLGAPDPFVPGKIVPSERSGDQG